MTTAAAAPRPYTAVLYFHGMGSQRRFEEVSRLVDCLDRYAFNHSERTGTLARIEADIEPPRGAGEHDVSFIKTRHLIRSQGEGADTTRRGADVRFYEVYWAALTAGGVESLQVVRWLLRQLPHPFAAVRTPWRLRARLRRATLYGMRARGVTGTADGDDTAARLLHLYDDFEGPEAWRRFPRGSFDEFLRFIADRANDDDTRARLATVALAWRRRYLLEELARAGVLVTIALTAALAAAAAASAVLAILAWISGSASFSFLKNVGAGELLDPSWTNVTGILAGAAWLFGVNRFLREYCGDVQVWATYEETDEKYQKRERILDASQAMLEHVLTDERCDRVVIIGHSLGTTVALDTLLASGRHSRARDGVGLPLGKIEHFVTLGSPVDKIHYFFESVRGRYHRYNRVTEDLRGDIGTVPFAKNRKPHIHWINVWDEADVISGALETPSHRHLTQLRVDNVEVASLGFPDPGRSHSAYFLNAAVIRVLFEVIFERKYSFRLAPRLPNGAYDYEAQMLGPGSGLVRTRIFQGLLVSIPWITLGALAARVAGRQEIEGLFWKLDGLAAGVLVAGFVIGKPWRCRCADKPDAVT